VVTLAVRIDGLKAPGHGSRMQMILRVTTAIFGLFLGVNGTAAEKKARGPVEPHPVSKTFYVSGMSTPQQISDITAAVAKLPSVTAVKELTPTSGYVRVDFDTHKIASHLVAQTIMDQGPFTVMLKFEIPEYAAHAERIDALFAKLLAERQVKIESVDKKKGQFVLTYLPIKPDPADPRKVGFNPGHLGHPIHDAPPSGMGLTLRMTEAPRTGAGVAKGKRKGNVP
jgi:copper chaperone CopZ